MCYHSSCTRVLTLCYILGHCTCVHVQSIQNPKVIPILLNWISDLDHPQRVMVLDQLNQLIPGSVFNKHQCCREGAIATILSVLGSSQTEQTYLGQDVEGWDWIEGMGCDDGRVLKVHEG